MNRQSIYVNNVNFNERIQFKNKNDETICERIPLNIVHENSLPAAASEFSIQKPLMVLCKYKVHKN